jgi:hypothetical protein
MMTAAADTSGVGGRCEDGSMTTVRGLLRSTATITADGHADDQSTARERAIAGLDLTTHDLVQTNTVSSTAAGNITVRAVARSKDVRPHQATGPNRAAAMDAYRHGIPEGWVSLHILVDD